MSRCSNMGGESKQKESLFRKILGRIKSDFLLVKAPLLVLVVFCILSQLIFHTMCPFVIVFGKPCSGCGLTRAGMAVLQGHFVDAMQIHGMIYFWMFLILYAVFFRYILGKRPPLFVVLMILVSIGTAVYYVYRKRYGVLPEVMYEGLLVWVKRLLEF